MVKKYNGLEYETATEIYRQLSEAPDLGSARSLVSRLVDGQPTMSVVFKNAALYWRARQCDNESGYQDSCDLLMPPKEIVRVGRANHNNMPMFYAADSIATALAEVRATAGSHYHLSAHIVREGSEVNSVLIGEKFSCIRAGYVRHFGEALVEQVRNKLHEFSVLDVHRILYVDSLLGDMISDNHASEKSYVLSRSVADCKFHINEPADCFFYPSVRQPFGSNLCIKPSRYLSKFKMVSSMVVRVDKVWRNGFFEMVTTIKHLIDPHSGKLVESGRKGNDGMFFCNITDSEKTAINYFTASEY